jgi:glutamyl/glutaminyl-tRNA synthetase
MKDEFQKLEDIILFCITKNHLLYKGILDHKRLISKVIGISKNNGIDPKLQNIKTIIKKNLELIKNKSEKEINQIFNSLKSKIKLPEKNNQSFTKFLKLKEYDNIFRFAPNPNFEPSIANMRGLFINFKIASLYKNSKVILRFDDTNPQEFKYLKKYYNSYIDCANWLGFKFDKIIKASERLQKYYHYIKDLANKKMLYLDTSSTKYFINPRPALEGNILNLKNTVRFQDNTVVLRYFKKIKCYWPTLRFQTSIDDILENITCILRGKDLRSTQEFQRKIFKIYNLEFPTTYYWGRNKFQDIKISSRYMLSLVKKYRKSPILLNLPSFSSIKYYGISPKAIIKWFNLIGLTENDTKLSIKMLKNCNREYYTPKNILIYNINKLERIYFSRQVLSNKKIPIFADYNFRKFIKNNKNKIIKFSKYNPGLYKINLENKLMKLLV